MNRLLLMVLASIFASSTSLDAFSLDRDGIFDKELNAKDGVPGRRVGGGSR